MWTERAPLDDDLRSAYLARLGVGAEPPSVDALLRLHRAQVERVPYETLWIHGGEAWDIDPLAAAERIAHHGRGGYCYHLNGAFGALLRSLGYDVRAHVGGVHGPDGPAADTAGNHLVLGVHGLACDANPSGVWYVDAGLGDALYEPVPLVEGAFTQAPFTFMLERLDAGSGDWHLVHDPNGGFPGMSWSAGDARPGDFVANHEWLSTSPESGFVQLAIAEHRDATGVDVMRGLVLTRVGSDARTSEPLTERHDWFAALADVFDLRFDHSAPGTADRLWERVVAGHREWEALTQQSGD
jgi:N-hydroxyarylamine O-acetyltransferase